jgi:hypothetical protein
MQHLQQNLGRYSQPTLTGMLAQRRDADVARAAEHRRLVTIALTNSHDTTRRDGAFRAPKLHGLPTRLAAVRTAIAHAFDSRAAALGGRDSNTGTAACCA